MKNKTIFVDECAFNKITKKLQQQIKTQKTDNNINLSLVREILSKSFGFNNYHNIQQFFNTQTDTTNITPFTRKNPSVFNLEVYSEVLISLMDSGASMWEKRATTLISAIIGTLSYLKEQGEISLDVDTLREHLIFDNIMKMYKTRRDFPHHIRSELRNYLVSLPGFQESSSKQNDTVLEQHGYLQMQFIKPLNWLKNLQDCDVLLFSLNWLEFKNDEKKVVTEKSLEELYKKFTKEKWSNYFNMESSFSINEKPPLGFKSKIIFSETFENSWLTDKLFLEILFQHFRTQKIKNFYMSDLVLFSSNNLNINKKEIYRTLITNFFGNYSTTFKLSFELQQLSEE